MFTVQLPPPPPPSKWEREYRAFRCLLPQLHQTHAGKYVAIHGGQVVDGGEDKLAVTLRVQDRLGNVDIHVGWVGTEPPRVVQVPHAEVLTKRGGST
jgi:hypothetical protein